MIDFRGPALSKHGLLAVAGAENILGVYKPVNLDIKKLENYSDIQNIKAYSSSQFLHFVYYITTNTDVKLILYDLRGRYIYNNILPGESGIHKVKLDYHRENISSGRYIYRLMTGKTETTNIIQILK